MKVKVQIVSAISKDQLKRRKEMIGTWKLACGLTAQVTMQSAYGEWLGVIMIEGYEIPSTWNDNGDSTNPAYNLTKKTVGPEIYAGG